MQDAAIATNVPFVFVPPRPRRLGWLTRYPLIPAIIVAIVVLAGILGPLAFALHEAGPLGLDALVTGEPSEPVMGEAREYGVHFLAGGHYATETFGVRRLGEHLAERFRLDHQFVDLPNPV